MAEPISEPTPSRTGRLYVFLAAIGLFALGSVGIYLYSRHQQNTQTTFGEVTFVPGMVRAGDPSFEYYKNKIRLIDVKAGLGVNFAKSRIAIISGIIHNEGDRKLEALELHIALYDVYDKLSKERIASPLRPGVGIKRPMDPLEKRPFTVWMEPIEQLWNPGRVEIEITGLKYQ